METPKLMCELNTASTNFEAKSRLEMQQNKLNLSALTPAPQSNVSPKSDNSKMTAPAVSYKGAANFRIRAKMGEGAVGEVYQVAHKTTCELFALKRVNKIQASRVSAI